MIALKNAPKDSMETQLAMNANTVMKHAKTVLESYQRSVQAVMVPYIWKVHVASKNAQMESMRIVKIISAIPVLTHV